MNRRRWMLFLGLAAALPLGALLYDRFLVMLWVGSTDLEIEFRVSDVGTGQPLEGARIDVHSEGGLYEERNRQEFCLNTDHDGVARRVCRRSMCFGARSGLGLTDTFVVHLPWWRFRVSCPGYQESEWIDLDVPEYIRQAHRAGPGAARLVVDVSIQKAPD